MSGNPIGDWQGNYFNYFTEVEEQFQKARGTALFLMSPLDWALVESWKNNGIPLEAVLRGIDDAFTKWRAKKNRTQAVNSLAYCSQAIAAAAEEMARGGPSVMGQKPANESSAPFPLEDLQSYFAKNIADIERQEYPEIAAGLRKIADESERWYGNLEELEMRLSALEEKMLAQARARQSEEVLFNARRELDLQLRPYRGKMTADQLSMLERQFLERKLLESSELPRLSLFYLR
ncbi:MAG TPA: hypothetical protein VGL53_15245 [Bryobacteraceae bacterium]|jgi:hypothetical protein